MARTKASRKYLLTLNNPADHGFTHARIKQTLTQFSGVEYWCMCDETGEKGTYHTHLYFCTTNPVQFHTVHQRFYGVHIETVNGTHRENRDYIRKEGEKHAEKKASNHPETFEESGELPPEPPPPQNVKAEIYNMIKTGCSNAQIVEAYPQAMNWIDHIEKTRQTLKAEEQKEQWRDLDVTYISGATGSGKTRSVMEKYGYPNVYRVTNYEHPFDGYQGQDVVIFEEFRSSLKIGDMLNFLDGYPLMLPCRYADKAACFTKVYILSNIPLEEQYPQVQVTEPATWAAFLRRTHHIEATEKKTNATGELPF